uniref:Uncharacterized protein n=1 Tax=Anguilla anguilla TaxID=7936 RepID=A0A0E9URV6_ANGAN
MVILYKKKLDRFSPPPHHFLKEYCFVFILL